MANPGLQGTETRRSLARVQGEWVRPRPGQTDRQADLDRLAEILEHPAVILEPLIEVITGAPAVILAHPVETTEVLVAVILEVPAEITEISTMELRTEEKRASGERTIEIIHSEEVQTTLIPTTASSTPQ